MCEEGMHIGGLWLGRCSGDGYSGRYLEGTIDEIRVWTRARSQDELFESMGVPLNAADNRGLLFYFPMDEAGMEMGANVIESRALNWFGVLGNSRGGGRPHWSVSQAPLSCTTGNRAPVCKRLASGDAFAATSGTAYAGDEDQWSVDQVATYVLLSAVLSALVAFTVTYTQLTGRYPPAMTACLGGVHQLVGSASGYQVASMQSPQSVPPSADWRWAQPARPDQQVAHASGGGGVTDGGGSTAETPPPRSYGGV